MPFADTATGARLHYEDLNPHLTGIPVIAVHGLLGTARLQLGHVLDWLADQNHHVYGLTLRGYGASTPKPRDFPANFYHRDADDVLAFMDALHIPQAHLLGFSDGGETVLVAAGKAPERVASVAAWGAVGSFGAELRPVFQRTYPGDWITDDDKALHGIPDAKVFTWQWVHATTRMIDAGGDVSLSRAAGITAPVLLMLGTADTLNPQTYGQKFVDAAPHAQLVMFECGHSIHDEQTEAFRRVVADHLQHAAPKI